MPGAFEWKVLHVAGLTLVLVLVAIAINQVLLWHRRRHRAGCVPLRVDPGGKLSMLLVQSRKHPEYWTFPGGGVEKGETIDQAAVRETREEAGLVGRLGRCICKVSDSKAVTSIFAMYVEAELEDSQWLEHDERKRRWFDLGVPNSPNADRHLAEVRRVLSPKPVHQRTLKACERLRQELAQEGERQEEAWGRPQRPGRRAVKAS